MKINLRGGEHRNIFFKIGKMGNFFIKGSHIRVVYRVGKRHITQQVKHRHELQVLLDELRNRGIQIVEVRPNRVGIIDNLKRLLLHEGVQ